MLETRLLWSRRLVILLFLGAGLVGFFGIAHDSPEPPRDPNTLRILRYAVAKRFVDIRQQSGSRPLVARVKDFRELPVSATPGLRNEEGVLLDETQWRRMSRIARELTAAANWGLGDVFDYEEIAGVRYVTRFRPDRFAYRNPFEDALVRPRPDFYASETPHLRGRAWRVLSGRSIFVLSPDAQRAIAVLRPGDSRDGIHIARRVHFLLANGDELRLSVGDSPVKGDPASFVRLERRNATGKLLDGPLFFGRGEYFIHRGVPFLVWPMEATTGTSTGLDSMTSTR